MKPTQMFCMAIALAVSLSTIPVEAREPTSAKEQLQESTVQWNWHDNWSLNQDSQQPNTAINAELSIGDEPTTKSDPTNPINPVNRADQQPRQPKRILWIIPNYRAVTATTYLPPLSFKEKTWLATEDTFDYSDFIFVGALGGISLAQKSEPSLGQGAAGYGRYYSRIFADTGIENYMAEAIVPAVTKEDPRYYVLGRGGFLKRTGYAMSRLIITRTDSGKNTLNISELIGSGGAAGIANAYYPPQANLWVKTYQRWGTQVALDGVFNMLKEFWPDIDHSVFHGKY